MLTNSIGILFGVRVIEFIIYFEMIFQRFIDVLVISHSVILLSILHKRMKSHMHPNIASNLSQMKSILILEWMLSCLSCSYVYYLVKNISFILLKSICNSKKLNYFWFPVFSNLFGLALFTWFYLYSICWKSGFLRMNRRRRRPR